MTFWFIYVSRILADCNLTPSYILNTVTPPDGLRREGVQLKEQRQADSIHRVSHCFPYKPVQWDPRTKLCLNCLAGVQGRSLSTRVMTSMQVFGSIG
jgi:hypothetical protein